jgi:hypothetical protein
MVVPLVLGFIVIFFSGASISYPITSAIDTLKGIFTSLFSLTTLFEGFKDLLYA